MLVCDTSGLIAYFDGSDTHHRRVSAAIDADAGPFIVSPYVLAEVDYLIAKRRGIQAEAAALRELSGGAWELAACEVAGVRRACDVMERYHDQEVGLTDASLVILAQRFRTDRLLTLDHRHFGVMRTSAGKSFTLLPA